jgi:hypothetical protein
MFFVMAVLYDVSAEFVYPAMRFSFFYVHGRWGSSLGGAGGGVGGSSF